MLHYNFFKNHYLNFMDDFSFLPEKNYQFTLSHLSPLTFTGENAKDFLQGQITCDLRNVNSKHMLPGALCNLQGRILALFDVLEWTCLQLLLPTNLLEDTRKSFSNAAMLSRVTISSPTYFIYGLYIQNDIDSVLELALPGNINQLEQNSTHCIYKIAANLYILISQANAHLENFIPAGLNGWKYLELKNRRLTIYPESRGLFLPHRLDFHKTQILSFDKGCYKGQEIIARTQYRAKLKHELKFFQIQYTNPLTPGLKIYSVVDNKEVGELVDFCRLDEEVYLIAVSILFEPPEQCRFQDQEEAFLLHN